MLDVTTNLPISVLTYRYRKRPSSNECAFSVLKLLAGMAIFSIVALIATPNMSELNSSFNRYNGTNQFEFDLRRVRAETISRGTRGVLSINIGGNGYTFGFDDLPFSDPAVADAAFLQRELPKDVTVTSTETIVFDTRGNLVDTDGVIITSNITISHNGSPYCTGMIYSTGMLELSC